MLTGAETNYFCVTIVVFAIAPKEFHALAGPTSAECGLGLDT
jgi:hypothetical protein